MAKIKLRLHPPSANASGSSQPTPSNGSGSVASPSRASTSPTAPVDPPPAPSAPAAQQPPSIVEPDPESEEADELEDEEAPAVPEPPKPKRKKRPSATTRRTPTSPPTATALAAAHDASPNETFDDLPAAKRRKANIRAGAAGPGRGWRKGLKVGQKPKYVHPGSPHQLMEEEDDVPHSRAPSPLAAACPSSGTPAAAAAATAATHGGSNGNAASLNGWSSKRSTGPPRIPPVPPSAPIRAPIKLTVGFAPANHAREPHRRVRHWVRGERAIATIGGGLVRVPTHWSGPDRDYDPHARAAAILQDARASGSIRSANLELPGTIVRTRVPSGIGTPLDQRAEPNQVPDPATISPAPKEGTGKKAHAKKSKSVAAPTSTLGSPAGSSAVGDVEQWRGSSPAYVFASGAAAGP